MTETMSGGIERLRGAMEGPVLLPGEAGYDDARATAWRSPVAPSATPVSAGSPSAAGWDG
ncbi:hypothetical protein [Pseudonocardia acidicola]|uniref:Uncharacterized protein n=1 Tax=Pseudonocardia acidicola TaxID=2724939 RepID=A0ABX1S439_9PSEU|nr:hypothetical protein [Pseudonocardia acidicola]NMH96296.1 hypothetical protein [Pseudonocardia acidicola]